MFTNLVTKLISISTVCTGITNYMTGREISGSCNQIYCQLLRLLVDQEGNVCISILHDPGDDRWGYEKPEERWLPVHTVETILISVISMLADPNYESPANVDAAVSVPLQLILPLSNKNIDVYKFV